MKRPGVIEHNTAWEPENGWKPLKPCPFCGKSDWVEYGIAHPQFAMADGDEEMDYWCYWYIHCARCGIEMTNSRLTEQTWEEARDEMIDIWNRRAEVES